MPNLLIRDIPEEVIMAIDARAADLGVSRSEYLRRRLRQEAQHPSRVEVGDLRRLATLCSDLADPEVMNRAWS